MEKFIKLVNIHYLAELAGVYRVLGEKIWKHKLKLLAGITPSPDEDYKSFELRIIEDDCVDIYNVQNPATINTTLEHFGVNFQGCPTLFEVEAFIDIYSHSFCDIFFNNIENIELRNKLEEAAYSTLHDGIKIANIEDYLHDYDKPLSVNEKKILKNIPEEHNACINDFQKLKDYYNFFNSSKFHHIEIIWSTFDMYPVYCYIKGNQLYSIINRGLKALNIKPTEYHKFRCDNDNIYAYYSINGNSFYSLAEDQEQHISRTIDTYPPFEHDHLSAKPCWDKTIDNLYDELNIDCKPFYSFHDYKNYYEKHIYDGEEFDGFYDFNCHDIYRNVEI